MREPTFSILIPAYNVGSYLAECLESVLRQTFKDWEAVIIDDGSTDGTRAVCDKFAEQDPRFRVFHQTNHGISFTRNHLIRRAGGTYIIFLDGDDYWSDQHMLQLVFDEIKNKQADVVAWRALLLDDRTKQMRECLNDLPVSRIPVDGIHFLHQMTRRGNCKWWGWLYAFQRELWNKSEVVYKEGRVICEDEEVLFLVLANARRVCAIDKYFYCYRVGRESSLTGTIGYAQISDMLEVSALNIRSVLHMELPTAVKKSLCGNFSRAYLENGPLLYFLEKEDQKKCFRLLQAYQGVLKYGKWNGNVKIRMKYVLIRLLGVRCGFGLLFIVQKIKGALLK